MRIILPIHNIQRIDKALLDVQRRMGMDHTGHDELLKGPSKEIRRVNSMSGPASLLEARAVDIDPVQNMTEDHLLIRDGECVMQVFRKTVEAAD